MIRFRYLAFVLACLALGGCRDDRRDVARGYLQTHAPAGFEVVKVPEILPVRDVTNDTSELTVSVRYRSTYPTIERRNGFDLPATCAVDAQLSELRGWALGSLPADSPLRAQFLGAIADARHAFPVKRVVTPAGTEVDALTTLTLRKANANWQVVGMESTAAVPGAADADPSIPLENAAAVIGRIAELRSVAEGLSAARATYLAERKRTADRSLAKLRALLGTGKTFTSTLPDGTNLRLVVTRGLEMPPAAIVLATRGDEQSAAHFTGAFEQKKSGETVWRAAQVTTLAIPTIAPVPAPTDAARHPILTLEADDAGLVGELQLTGRPASKLHFQSSGSVELIPEAQPQPAAVQ